MNEIKCPHCGEMFTIDEAGFAAILKQVRDAEFDKEVRRHEQLLTSEKQQAVQLAVAEALAKAQGDAAQKEARIAELEARLQAEQRERENQQRLAHAERERALADAVATKDARIAELEQRVEAQGRAFEAEKKLAVEQARSALERERDALAAQVALKDAEKSQATSALKEQLAIELKAKDDIIAYKEGEIERYKDMKARLSTKMVGESLEQHCETEFNKIRAAAFPRAYFEKDNDASEGSKGDFIFRECDEEGNEIVSIMFEMKNESDDSSHRHKNEDFFKKLDADRRKKGCEYAVLVTLLEPESELYNQGIVDVSYRFEKMYAIRPQFFLPMISILRNAALNSMAYKAELAVVRNQNIDITKFEEQMETFKSGFARNYDLASRKFQTAIDEIDKTILHLQKTKDALVSSENNLRLANNKAQDLTIKRLTRNNPTMKAAFEALAEEKDDTQP
ncbi:DUF2130 domain-containing protein [Eggerthella lenta]|uniref:DUF2130 domain-containing protein n=1 Tax=Eggerthella lenta TaxID=84112 RepID=A0A369NFF7_EGGLN|nr:DUF2130 domain-containing protein [Eggerthella lenta]KGI73523.1 hypothetical protein HMPREF9458_01252 [Eggerthella lenta 1_1_60AFAA]RDB81852.1 DUF2130 domain-containing protein [Eggerthella lenta]RDB89220.1 DUF2130 domain-containing protein [Eggerthella lenta]RDC10923.1 DUF2130 domain-containing protein [Eggerthella lenta]